MFPRKALGEVNNQVLDSPKTIAPSDKLLSLAESLFGSNEKLLFEQISAVVGGHEFKLKSKIIISKIISMELKPIMANFLMSRYLKDRKKETNKKVKDPLLDPISEIQ